MFTVTGVQVVRLGLLVHVVRVRGLAFVPATEFRWAGRCGFCLRGHLMGVVSRYNKGKKNPNLLLGAGEGGGEGRESVREGKVASACVVCRDAEMLLPDIIS